MGVVRRHEHSVRQVSLANRNDYDEKQTNTEQTSLELLDEYYRDNSMLRLENEINVLGDLAVDKAETYAYTDSLLGPSCLECIDDFLLLSIFRDVFVCEDVDFRYGRNQNVVVKVKATIIAPGNERMERDRLSFDVEDKLSESIFVGEVLNSDPSAEVCAFNNGAPVTSLRKCSVKSRLVSVPAESLISLPKKLDAGEVAALVSTYLPAFGALHHGREVRVREKRFLRSSFKMQKILVTGGGTSEADAVVKLALLGGAFRVFLVKSRKTVGKNHIGSHRVIRLNDDPKEWLSRLDGLVDVVVDLEYPKNFEAIQASVAEEGRIVCRAPASSRSLLKNLVQIKEQAALCFVKGATMYDFDDMCESNNSDVLKDLKFLVELLAARKLRPNIDKYIKMRDVSVVREDMQRHPVVGAVVCEPWRDVGYV